MASKLIPNAPLLKEAVTHKGVWYWPTMSQADSAMTASAWLRWLHTARVVEYQRGFAVQLHKSGPYLGPDLEPATHKCKWCRIEGAA